MWTGKSILMLGNCMEPLHGKLDTCLEFDTDGVTWVVDFRLVFLGLG